MPVIVEPERARSPIAGRVAPSPGRPGCWSDEGCWRASRCYSPVRFRFSPTPAGYVVSALEGYSNEILERAAVLKLIWIILAGVVMFVAYASAGLLCFVIGAKT